MSTSAAVPKKYRWTPTSRRILAALIKGTISYNRENGLTPSDYRDLEVPGKCTYVTVRSYAECSVRNFQQRNIKAPALEAIAPQIYKYVGVSNNGLILFDPQQRYENWLELADQIADLENLPGVPNREVDLTDEDNPAATPLTDSGFQLAIPTARTDSGDLIAVTQQLTRLFEIVLNRINHLEALVMGGNTVLSKENPLKHTPPMAKFLIDWVNNLSDQKKAELEITGLDEVAAIKKLMASLGFTESRADEILDGGTVERRELFSIGYLFVDLTSGQPYPLSHWETLAGLKVQETVAA
ncbi:MAG TPA: hypothetical protein V6D07_19110 [Trichocoleus sp.]